MNNNHVYDMLVVGGGPGGYTAALYAARAGLDTVVLEKLSAGGQMALTEQIDNYPASRTGSTASLWRRRCKSRRSVLGHAANTRKFSAWI